MAVLLGGAGTRTAHAQSINGRTRLGFESGFLQHVSGSATFTGTTASSTQDQSYQNTTFGLQSFGVVVGYGLSKNAFLGADLSFSDRNQTVEGESASSSLGGSARATIAYVIGESAVRPFVGPLIGISYSESERWSVSTAEHTFSIGLQAGAFAFATPSFSIDPSITFAFATGAGHTPYAPPNEDSTATYDFGAFVIGIQLAMSGWLGGESAKPALPDDDPPATSPAVDPPEPVVPAYRRPDSEPTQGFQPN